MVLPNSEEMRRSPIGTPAALFHFAERYAMMGWCALKRTFRDRLQLAD
jgi:hypothetical protein